MSSKSTFLIISYQRASLVQGTNKSFMSTDPCCRKGNSMFAVKLLSLLKCLNCVEDNSTIVDLPDINLYVLYNREKLSVAWLPLKSKA